MEPLTRGETLVLKPTGTRVMVRRSAASKAGRGRLIELDVYALIVRAWNAVRGGKPVGRGRVSLPREGTGLPEPE